MAVVEKAPREDPTHITYMLTPDMCDWFFLVGNSELCTPERIGVVKKILLAQSEVLRSEMLSRELDDKKDVVVTDTYPDTFRDLLRFVYGYDNTALLSFEEADNLLYVAEKYQVARLKDRLSTRLMVLLNPENVCALLDNPVCFIPLQLKVAITWILQNETARVFASSSFLDLSSDALSKVFDHEVLSVPEVEVWKAAVSWAKHRAKCDDIQALRRELDGGPAKHIRVCAIDPDSFFNEVVSTGLLTSDEMVSVCLAKGKCKRQEDLECFSRKVACRESPPIMTESRIQIPAHSTKELPYCVITLTTNELPIELLPLTCTSNSCFGNTTHKIKWTLTVVKQLSDEPAITVEDCQQVCSNTEFSIPLAQGPQNIVLKPNSEYLLTIQFRKKIKIINCFNPTYSSEHVNVRPWGFNEQYFMPSRSLRYKTLCQ